MSSSNRNISLVGLSIILSGCFQSDKPTSNDTITLPLNLQNHTYVNIKHPQTTMSFHQDTVIFEHHNSLMTKHYTLNGKKIILTMASSSLETRPNLELIIVSDATGLICTQCGQFGLSSQWELVTD